MSLNTNWDRKYISRSSTVSAHSSVTTELPVQVNTPQSSPASWPQLGAEEQLPTTQMSNAPINQTESQSGWGSIPPGMNTNSDYDGTSAWGRLPDIKSAASPSHQMSGWGEAPSTTSSWGQSQPNVDDGTAVWDKSTVSHQPQGNWGGGGVVDPVPKNTDTPGGAWGGNTANPEPPNPQIQKPPVTKPTTASNPIPTQPVSWAKAASTGLPTSENSAPSEPAHDEAQPENTEAPSQPTPPIDNDPMHQLVNSHDGWGKKPIQQSTSWNVSNEPVTNPGRPVNNGTEAWGKASSGQLPPASGGWNKAPAEPNNWGAGGANNYSNQSQAGSNWRAPPQQQQMPPQAHSGFMGNVGGGSSGGGAGGAGGWGDAQMMPGNSHNGRWGEMPMQRGNSNPQTGNWNRDVNLSSNWSNGPQPRPGQGGPGWNNNMMPQSGNMDNNWGPGRMMEGGNNARRPSTVDNGTAAWGDPTTYNKVNLWEKSGKPGADGAPNPGGPANGEQKPWGIPQSQPSASPKGWGDLSPTTPSSNDKGASGWGQKQLPGNEKGWDNKEGSNWNSGPGKMNAGSNYTNDWGAQQPDAGSGWESQGLMKNEMMMKNNMDYGRGKLSQQSNLSSQNMIRGVPPGVPPQLQAQLQQIQNAAASGIIPSQVLNPHLMTPQHMHALIQLVNKATELRNIQMQFNVLSQNKNISPMIRHQQLEHFSRSIRQTQQQIEVLRGAIMQNVLQNSQNLSKPNMPGSGMDLRPGQAMMSPLNTVGSLGQALPNLPNSPMANPGNREMKSRFINNWNRNKMNGMGDGGMPLEGLPNAGFMPGPGGDFEFSESSPFESNSSSYLDNLKMQFPEGMMQRGNMPGEPTVNPVESATGLNDIGPPEFTPGVPWKGFRHIDPEEDHDITPGSVAIAKTMSLNTVRDADQVLKRERSGLSESSTGLQSGLEKNIPSQPSVNANSEINAYQWSTGANGANPAPKMTPSMLSHELWKVPLSSGQSNYQSSPSYQQNKKLGPSWDQSNPSMEQPTQQRMLQQQGGWGAPDARGSWLVLTNVNAQVNIASLEQLCMQQGIMQSFRPSFPIEGMALVKYATFTDAENAKKALNMYMAGTTMIVATVATDQEVNNFVTAGNNGSKSLSWQSGGNNGNRLSSMGSTGGFISQPPLGAGNDASWGNNKTSSGWANPPWSRGAGEEGSRIMSPMDSLLPVNLLGGETM